MPISTMVKNDMLTYQKTISNVADDSNVNINYIHSDKDHNEIIHVNTPALFDEVFTQYNIPKTAFPVKFPFYVKVAKIQGNIYYYNKDAYNSVGDLIRHEYWNVMTSL